MVNPMYIPTSASATDVNVDQCSKFSDTFIGFTFVNAHGMHSQYFSFSYTVYTHDGNYR